MSHKQDHRYTFVADTSKGRDMAFMDAEDVALAFVVDGGVKLYLYAFDEPVTLSCSAEEAKRLVAMVADVRESLTLDRKELEQKGDVSMVTRREIFLGQKPVLTEAEWRERDRKQRIRTLEEKVLSTYEAEGKIWAIKHLRKDHPGNLGLKDAKDYVEKLIDIGVTVDEWYW